MAIRALELFGINMPAVNRGETAVAAGIRFQAVAVVAKIRGRLLRSIAEVLEVHLRSRG